MERGERGASIQSCHPRGRPGKASGPNPPLPPPKKVNNFLFLHLKSVSVSSLWKALLHLKKPKEIAFALECFRPYHRLTAHAGLLLSARMHYIPFTGLSIVDLLTSAAADGSDRRLFISSTDPRSHALFRTPHPHQQAPQYRKSKSEKYTLLPFRVHLAN